MKKRKTNYYNTFQQPFLPSVNAGWEDEIKLVQKIFILLTFILLFYIFNKTSIDSADKNFGLKPKKSFLGSVKSYNKDEKIHPTPNQPDVKSAVHK